jgi:hypothetical protein
VVCYEHNYKAYFDSCEYSFAYHNQSSPWGGGWTIVDSCDFFGGGGGINELSSLSSFTVYPNPASSYATISLNVTQNATFNICVKNMQGQNIIAGMQLENLAPGEHNINMNTSNIAQGIYLVECRTEAGVLYSKVVIQR